MSKPRRKKRPPKRILALPDLEQSKAAVLNTLTSKSGQRSYHRAITDFVDWYCSEPWLSFNRTVVLRSHRLRTRLHPRMASGLSQNRPTIASSHYRQRARSGASLHARNHPVHRELPLWNLRKEIRCNFRSLQQYSFISGILRRRLAFPACGAARQDECCRRNHTCSTTCFRMSATRSVPCAPVLDSPPSRFCRWRSALAPIRPSSV